ncbi:hypothetical protein [Halovivax sp.]|uniref:hypothetical protein n=1 Tax=Halovivax sp. TaxID=1935978 RepID=UPI0025B9029F|nr:hypothetical protein [Halovivax sp.]
MSQNRTAGRCATEAFAALDAEPAVDEILADCEVGSPDEIIALADESSEADAAEPAPAVFESGAVEPPERVEKTAGRESVGGPSMDELFGERRL